VVDVPPPRFDFCTVAVYATPSSTLSPQKRCQPWQNSRRCWLIRPGDTSNFGLVQNGAILGNTPMPCR
jgi:hypothetical protein